MIVGEENKQVNVVSNRQIGVIIPPPDIKKIIDRTAAFIAKNGSVYEAKIFATRENDPMFTFLRDTDPFYAYYQEKIVENARVLAGIDKPRVEVRPHPQILRDGHLREEIKAKVDIKPPPPDQFAVQHPGMAAVDMDMIKLTAQFVARNGQKFLAGLTDRERSNPQFDFLKPTHAFFGYFTALLDSYSKCLIPRKEEILKLQRYMDDKDNILKTCGDRYQYEKMQKEQQKKKGVMTEEEKFFAAQIDWYDFVLVETIDLFDDEEMEAFDEEDKNEEMGVNMTGPAQRQAAQTEMEDMDVDMEIDEDETKVRENYMEDVLEPDIKVVKNYVRKSDANKKGMQKCDKCGQLIPLDQWNEHMRIELLDPRYLKEKQEINERKSRTTMAGTDAITNNLQSFASNRPDLFGEVSETISANNEVHHQDFVSKNKNDWMQQLAATSVSRATQANAARNRDKELKNLEAAKAAQVPNVVLSQQGKPMVQTSTISASPILNPLTQFTHIRPLGVGNLFSMDKHKIEGELHLIPEDQWLMIYPNPIPVTVRVPEYGPPDESWNFRGQIYTLVLEPTKTISELKRDLSDYLNGMPPQKMRLKTLHHSALKDNYTLAKCNIAPGMTIELGFKERGGRK